MLPDDHPDRIQIAFDDHRLVANAGLILPTTLARHLGLPQLVDQRLDLGNAPGRANTGDKIMTLVASALAGGDCIDDAAWLAVQVMAHNLARWTVRIGLGEPAVTTKTLRRRFFSLAERPTMHLPQHWPWETQFSRALARLRSLPFPAWPNRQTTQPPRRLARSVPERLLLYAALTILPRTRNCGPSTSPLRGYRTLHPAISIGIKPSRIFPLPLIPCLPDMATSLRWIRGKNRVCRQPTGSSPLRWGCAHRRSACDGGCLRCCAWSVDIDCGSTLLGHRYR